MNALVQRLADLIGPFEPAEGPPPQTLMAFLRWCLKGAWPMFFLAFAVSAIAGIGGCGGHHPRRRHRFDR